MYSSTARILPAILLLQLAPHGYGKSAAIELSAFRRISGEADMSCFFGLKNSVRVIWCETFLMIAVRPREYQLRAFAVRYRLRSRSHRYSAPCCFVQRVAVSFSLMPAHACLIHMFSRTCPRTHVCAHTSAFSWHMFACAAFKNTMVLKRRR